MLQLQELQKYSILFEWSKGASQRKKLLSIINNETAKGNAVYVSRLTYLFNSSLATNENSLTNSSIRKYIKVLKIYGFIKAVNEGGRPEYLELTENGLKAIEKLNFEKIVSSKRLILN